MIVTIEGIHLRRSSGIDHQLIRVTVFVQPCRCDQKFCPVLPPSRKAVCRFAGKCKIFFGFVWHLKLLSVSGYKKSGQPFHRCPQRYGMIYLFDKLEVSDFFFRYSLSLGFPHDRNNPRSPDVPAGLCHKAFHYPQRHNHTS